MLKWYDFIFAHSIFSRVSLLCNIIFWKGRIHIEPCISFPTYALKRANELCQSSITFRIVLVKHLARKCLVLYIHNVEMILSLMQYLKFLTMNEDVCFLFPVFAESIWDPMSSSQTKALAAVLKKLMAYPSVNMDNKNTQVKNISKSFSGIQIFALKATKTYFISVGL